MQQFTICQDIQNITHKKPRQNKCVFLSIISMCCQTYFHFKRALAVIKEDHAQPEFRLLRDPGLGREAPESPGPWRMLFHVRVPFSPSLSGRIIHHNYHPESSYMQESPRRFTHFSPSSSSSSLLQGSVSAAGARALRMLVGTLTLTPETDHWDVFPNTELLCSSGTKTKYSIYLF